jgi:hypothetical protein
VEKTPREQRGRQNRTVRGSCDLAYFFRHIQSGRENQTVRAVLEESPEAPDAFLRADAFEIGVLGLADHLYAFVGEVAEEAGEGKSGPIHHGFDDRMIQSRIHDDTQPEPFPASLHKLAQCEHRRLVLSLFSHFALPANPQLRTEPLRAARTLPLRALTRILRS